MYRGLPALLFFIFIEYRTSNVERRTNLTDVYEMDVRRC